MKISNIQIPLEDLRRKIDSLANEGLDITRSIDKGLLYDSVEQKILELDDILSSILKSMNS